MPENSVKAHLISETESISLLGVALFTNIFEENGGKNYAQNDQASPEHAADSEHGVGALRWLQG